MLKMSPKKSLEMHCSVTFYFKLSDREVPSNGGTGIILKLYQTQNSYWRKDGGKNTKHTTQKKKKKLGIGAQTKLSLFIVYGA